MNKSATLNSADPSIYFSVERDRHLAEWDQTLEQEGRRGGKRVVGKRNGTWNVMYFWSSLCQSVSRVAGDGAKVGLDGSAMGVPDMNFAAVSNLDEVEVQHFDSKKFLFISVIWYCPPMRMPQTPCKMPG